MRPAHATCFPSMPGAGNFALNIELWDHLFGTYRDYSEIIDKHRAKARGKAKVA